MVNRPPHVLVLFEYASLNGGENSFLAAARPWRKEQVRLTAGVMDEGPLLAELTALGAAITVLPTSLITTQSEKRQSLKALLEAVRPDLVHANSLSMTRLAGPIAHELGVPLLGHIRDIQRPSRQVIVDICLATRLLAVSDATKRWYEELGVPTSKLFTLYNGVDVSQFNTPPRKAGICAELQLGPGPIVLGIGQLGLRKGFGVWLQAASEILTSIPDAHFLIVGEQHSQKSESDEHVAELLRVASHAPLAGRVHWLGRRIDVPALLCEADLLLHAARQEPLGRVLLEGLAAGIPIVATRVGGTAEILPPEDAPIALAEMDNPAELAAKAVHLLKSAELQASIRVRYPRRARELFCDKMASVALLEHYRAVCSTHANLE